MSDSVPAVPPSRRRSSARPDVRDTLRFATAAAHERMHAHPGFAAAAGGGIALDDYRMLLARLYGFHRPFEALLRESAITERIGIDVAERARSPALAADLDVLGVDRTVTERLPMWSPGRPLPGAGALLGGLYVIEGSTLGGVQIARALKRAAGGDVGCALRFFEGHGDRQGALWRRFVLRIEEPGGRPEAVAEAVETASGTFADFEGWMAGWRTPLPGALG